MRKLLEYKKFLIILACILLIFILEFILNYIKKLSNFSKEIDWKEFHFVLVLNSLLKASQKIYVLLHLMCPFKVYSVQKNTFGLATPILSCAIFYNLKIFCFDIGKFN